MTDKGEFASHVYADEITLGEVFATALHESLDEYQILLLLAAIVYEPRERDEFKQKFRNDALKKLKTTLRKNEWLAKEKKFLSLDVMTTVINPIYNGKTFFDVMDFTSLLEGDLIRLYSQVLDRLGQIKKAGYDSDLSNKVNNCQGIVKQALEGIYLV